MAIRKEYKGFTLVELLIVIVVISILASISIVMYRGVRERAYATAVQSDLSGAGQKLQIYQTIHNSFPVSIANLNDADLTASKDAYNVGGYGGAYGNFYYCLNKTTDEFALGARARQSNQGYIYTSTRGGVKKLDATNLNSNVTCGEVGATTSNRVTATGMSTSGVWSSWVK